MSDVLLNILLSFITAATAWFFARRKYIAEAQKSEIDNAQSALKYYREMIDDMSLKHRECMKELDGTRELIKELEEKLDKYIKENRDLLEELKKYKQLNGKQL